MELVVAAFIVSIAHVYAPLLRLHAARRLRIGMPAGTLSPTAPAVPATELIELPPQIERWCEQESEEFARDEAKETAKRLYAAHGDWNVVLGELEKGF